MRLLGRFPNPHVHLGQVFPGAPPAPRVTRWMPPDLLEQQPTMLALAEFRESLGLLYPANYLARALCDLAGLPAIIPNSPQYKAMKATGAKLEVLPAPRMRL